VHLTAYTVLKRQLLDCLGQFLESNGGQFLASAEDYHRLIRHHSPSAGTPLVLSDKITGPIARTFQSSGPWLASGL
jgi:hypothetical protein